MKHVLAIVAVLGLSACGGSSSPTTPSAQRFTLTGTVRFNGAPISAQVLILDGPDANQGVTTDANGRYVLANLQPGTFNLRTTAPCCVPSNQSVTLTRDQTLDFTLTRRPIADLVAGGAVNGVLQPDGSYDFPFTATNNGPDCAIAISGTTTFTRADGSFLIAAPWSLPTSVTVAASATFTYHVTLSAANAFAGGSYSTTFAFTAVICQ